MEVEGEEDLKEAARMARTKQIQIMVKAMGLRPNIFDPEAHT